MNPMQKTCPACQGHAYVPNAQSGAPCLCPVCGGEGKVAAPVTRRLYFYVFNGPAAGLGALATFNGVLNIDSRAPFEVYAITGNRAGAYTLQITDQTGRTYQNAAVNDVNAVGTAQQLFPLPVPLILPANGSLNITLVDTSGGGANIVQLVFCGYELYPEE